MNDKILNRIKKLAFHLKSKIIPKKNYIHSYEIPYPYTCFICWGNLDNLFNNSLFYKYHNNQGGSPGEVNFYVNACSYECLIEFIKFHAEVFESLEKTYREKLIDINRENELFEGN